MSSVRPRSPGLSALAFVLVAGCGSQVSSTVVADAGPSIPSGLPCDVARVVAANCLSCHGANLARNVNNHLLTREQWLAPSAANPAQSYLQRAVLRMRDPNVANAMPPNVRLDEADIAPFEAWLAAGGAGAACDGDAGAVTVDASFPPGDQLPCAVQGLLAAECTSCHAAEPRNDAGVPLVTLADLRAESAVQPGATVAQRAVTRMTAHSMSMPPSGPLAIERIQPFLDWVAVGAPGTTCEAPVPDPFTTPVQCTSNRNWTGGNRESPSMNPGQACIACHRTMRGPSYTFAGTLYPSAHEPDNCYGTSGTAVDRAFIELRGADGRTIQLVPNSVGNFYIRATLALPYTARVIVGDQERRMNGAQMSGDCNTCHTEDGTDGAPGRIIPP